MSAVIGSVTKGVVSPATLKSSPSRIALVVVVVVCLWCSVSRLAVMEVGFSTESVMCSVSGKVVVVAVIVVVVAVVAVMVVGVVVAVVAVVVAMVLVVVVVAMVVVVVATVGVSAVLIKCSVSGIALVGWWWCWGFSSLWCFPGCLLAI